jgi:LVIVD repeat
MRLKQRARRRLMVALTGLALIGAAVYGAAAFAGEGDVNTIRVMPGPTSAAEEAAVSAAKTQVGADYVASDNVEFVRSFKLAADGVGARVVGNYLYVTTTKDLEIFDISTPTDPQLLGLVTIDIEFENEQVPTNGSVLGISGQTPSTTAGGICPSTYPVNTSSGCLVLFDVRDKSHPVQVATVQGAGDHTSTCVLDCTYMYGSSGSITDLRGVLGSSHTATKLTVNWIQYLKSKGYPFYASCHHNTEVRPGVILTACDPIYLLSVRKQDGGSITAPKVLGSADFLAAPDDTKRFVHGVEFPRQGADRIMLAGGETNFQPTCGATNGAFATFVTKDGKRFTFADQIRPVAGNYLDGNPPQGAFHLGCSVHWFEPQPSFRNGGLVAMASYENGTRFLRIASDGKISEVGFFEPLGGATSAPHWARDGRTVYAIDYQRGLDVLRWNGPLYVP